MWVTPLSMQALMGIFLFIAIAFMFSEKKLLINWRLVLSALVLENLFFVLINYVPVINNAIMLASEAMISLLEYSKYGAQFIFGDFAVNKGYGFVFIIVVIPMVIFFSTLISLLFSCGVIQSAISLWAKLFKNMIKLSGIESLVIVTNMFIGMVESPLVVAPYLHTLARAELSFIFTAGLSKICGSTVGMYAAVLSNGSHIENITFANLLITAILMNSLSTIIFATILFPYPVNSKNPDIATINIKKYMSVNVIDSIYKGSISGLKVSMAIISMLIASISIIHMLDGVLGHAGSALSINVAIINSTGGAFKTLSLEYVFGELFRLFAFFMGISWHDTLQIGSLLGQKVVFNEFIAYINLGHMKLKHIISEDSVFIAVFGLASFSNISSVGISLGIFGVLSPERKNEISAIVWRSLLSAVLSGFFTASVAGFWHYILKY